MPDKPDLTNPRNLINWVLYGLAAVAGWAYFDMRTQRDSCQDENNFFARESFKNAMKIQVQEETIKIMDTAITESKNYISDSIQPVNVKNLTTKIKKLKK